MDSKERAVIQEYKNELAIHCECCFGKIGFKQKCTPNVEGGYSHIKCAVSSITHRCPQCGYMSDGETYGEDEPYCEECNAVMKPISKAQVRKKLKKTTPAEHDPDMYEIEE